MVAPVGCGHVGTVVAPFRRTLTCMVVSDQSGQLDDIRWLMSSDFGLVRSTFAVLVSGRHRRLVSLSYGGVINCFEPRPASPTQLALPLAK